MLVVCNVQYNVVDGYKSAERESKGFNDFYVFTVNGRCMEKFNKKFDLWNVLTKDPPIYLSPRFWAINTRFQDLSWGARVPPP